MLKKIDTHEYDQLFKMTRCQTLWLGARECRCTNHKCNEVVYYSNSCQTQFCPTCAYTKKLSYLEKVYATVLDTEYFFVTYTLPYKLRPYVRDRRNRRKMLKSLKLAIVESIMEFCKEQKIPFMPGIILMLHTFNKESKWHPHVHLIVTAGGVALEAIEEQKQIGFKTDQIKDSTWISHHYLPVEMLKKRCNAKLLKLLRKYHKKNILKFDPGEQMYAYENWNNMLSAINDNGDYIHIRKDKGKTKSMTHAIQYALRYLGHPPLAMSGFVYNRDRQEVFWTPAGSGISKGKKQPIRLSVSNFVLRMADHIPCKHDRSAAFYGIYSYRNINRSLRIAKAMPQFKDSDLRKKLAQQREYEQNHKWKKIQEDNKTKKKKLKKPGKRFAMKWRERIKHTYGNDPLKCPKCGSKMKITKRVMRFDAKFCRTHKIEQRKIVAVPDTS